MAGIVVVTGMAFEARIAAGTGVEVLYGGHDGKLERELAERLRHPCDGVISFGVAGGLDPLLMPGSIVVPERIASGEQSFDTNSAWSAMLRNALPTAVGGILASGDAAVASVADKQALRRASGALAIDMESHLVARLAFAARVPYVACRIILDPAQRALPSAALAAFGRDGHTDMKALLSSLASHPGQLSDLLQLARDARTAKTALRKARTTLGLRYALPEAPVYLASA